MKIECRPITKENEDALALANDPFLEEGRVIPIFDGEKWSYKIERFAPDKITENCFPDEHYVFEDMGDNFHGIAIYADGVCAGFALVFEEWNKWLYLDNLLISKQYRRNGLGSALIDACMELAKQMNKIGVYLVCQDNNLQAMKFYFNRGFVLGGMNMFNYEGTKQEGKTDLYLYKRNADN